MNNTLSQPRADYIALTLMAIGLPALVYLHLLPALLSGLLVHELIHILAPRLFGVKNLGRAKIATLVLLLAIIIVGIAGLIVGIVLFLRSDSSSWSALLEKLAESLERFRETLPLSMQQWIPAEASELRNQIVNWLRDHARDAQLAGGALGHGLTVSLVGMVIGALLALREAENVEKPRFLASALMQAASRLSDAFRNIVFAQVRISALNSLLTGIYLLVVLPLLGVDLPLAKTMVLITFLVGLLPVLGNLISNTIIVIISLNYSLEAAIGSLGFLVVIHKLEYFINARIVGARIQASAWELLSAMLVMQQLFGVPGIVAAPIFYAYYKSELTKRHWI